MLHNPLQPYYKCSKWAAEAGTSWPHCYRWCTAWRGYRIHSTRCAISITPDIYAHKLSVRVRNAIKSPDNAISHLPVHLPLWASLPDDPLTYPCAQLLCAVPGILELNDVSCCCCFPIRSAYYPLRPSEHHSCTIYTLTGTHCTWIELQLCPSCPRTLWRFIGPETRAFLTSTIRFCSLTIFLMNIQAHTHHQRRLLLDGCPWFHINIRTMTLRDLSSWRRCSELCGFHVSSWNTWKQCYSATHVVLCLRTQYETAWLCPSVKNTCFHLSSCLQFYTKIHSTAMKSAITATCSGFQIRNFANPFEKWYKVDLLFSNRTMKMTRPTTANLGATWRRRANRTSWTVLKRFQVYWTTWTSLPSHWRMFSAHTLAFKPWVQESNLRLFIVGF